MALYNYNVDDLQIDPSGPGQVGSLSGSEDQILDGTLRNSSCQDSRFDKLLKSLWERAMEEGQFRYKLIEPLQTKILPGKYRFVTQLNPHRLIRRKPQEITSLSQSFDPNTFNFTKVKPDEVIIKLVPYWNSSSSNPQDHLILINVSPLEYGNVLLVPSLTSGLPQAVTEEGIRLALEMVLLSGSIDFRVGFNSLCGYASVNHHHYHAYYLDHRLYIESADLKRLSGPCFEFDDPGYPSHGFIFLMDLDGHQCSSSNEFVQSLEKVTSTVFKLIQFLQSSDIAHNLFITRGRGRTVRVFVWAREPSYGSKRCDVFNPALSELAGHFPIKQEDAYNNMTEDYLCQEMETVTRKTFESIKPEVVQLFQT